MAAYCDWSCRYKILSDQNSNIILDVDGKVKVDDKAEMDLVRKTMNHVDITPQTQVA